MTPKTASTPAHPSDAARALPGLPADQEIERMVRELEARHGLYAASVARFIAEFNEQNGRAQQSVSWQRVCSGIEARTLDRIRQREQRPIVKIRYN
jgi:hypothetical protein